MNKSLDLWKFGQVIITTSLIRGIPMFGLGKKRTPFGEYLDRRGIKQQWLVQRTGLSKSLISDLANKKDRIPTLTSATKIIKTLRKFDKRIDYHDFWDINA